MSGKRQYQQPPMGHPGDQQQQQMELQAQAQAELQAQLQGQGQGQCQMQGQGQYSVSENGNLNGNLNGNGNGNLNGNGNFNGNESTNGNLNGNLNANGNLNGNHNSNTNTTETTTDTTTTTKVDVDVDVDLGLEGYMPEIHDNDMIDVDTGGSVGDVFMANEDLNFDPGNELNLHDLLEEALNGAGNDSGQIFAQANNNYDDDTLESPSVSNTASFSATGTVTGGESSTGDGIGATGSSSGGEGGFGIELPGRFSNNYGRDDDDGVDGSVGQWGSGNGDDGYVAGSASASADAAMDLSAFNQSIVMGANVLGNTVDTTVVGGNMTSTYTFGDDEA